VDARGRKSRAAATCRLVITIDAYDGWAGTSLVGGIWKPIENLAWSISDGGLRKLQFRDSDLSPVTLLSETFEKVTLHSDNV
jgi:hypothetical protein